MNQIGNSLAQLQIDVHSISDNEIENEPNMSESELEEDFVETEAWNMRLAQKIVDIQSRRMMSFVVQSIEIDISM